MTEASAAESASASGTARRAWAAAFLFLGLVGASAGHAYLLAALPALGRAMGLEDLQVGAMLSLGALGVLVAGPLWALLSERIGRRPVLLIGLAAAALSPALFGVLISGALGEGGPGAPVAALGFGSLFLWLMLTRLAQTLLGGGLQTTAQAFFGDISRRGRRAQGMGVLGGAFGLGGVLGATVLWSLAQENPALGLYVIAAIAAASLILTALFLGETRPADEKRVLSPTGGPPLVGRIWPFLSVTFLGVASFAIVQHVTGFHLLDRFGLTAPAAAATAGGLMLSASLAMIAAQLIALQLLIVRPWPVLALAALLAAAGAGWASQAETLRAMAMALGVFGFGLGLMLPSNLGEISLRAGLGAQGPAAALNALPQGLGLIAGPITGASLYHALGPLAFAAVGGLLLLAGLFGLMGGLRAEPSPRDHGEP